MRDESPVSRKGGAAIEVIEWTSVLDDRGAAEDKRWRRRHWGGEGGQ